MKFVVWRNESELARWSLRRCVSDVYYLNVRKRYKCQAIERNVECKVRKWIRARTHTHLPYKTTEEKDEAIKVFLIEEEIIGIRNQHPLSFLCRFETETRWNDDELSAKISCRWDVRINYTIGWNKMFAELSFWKHQGRSEFETRSESFPITHAQYINEHPAGCACVAQPRGIYVTRAYSCFALLLDETTHSLILLCFYFSARWKGQINPNNPTIKSICVTFSRLGSFHNYYIIVNARSRTRFFTPSRLITFLIGSLRHTPHTGSP